ncbi:hypothetical protein [Priestia megaterium]|uniref:hypothetical protein n=1 Tax=Priestia megaterium TaxID=1404 RepID=UPI000BFCEEF6|nr:hypothetical protein [Priestia megaterium]PGQ88247.1 hypothetical protein COA18_04790 [Priestia megaterium]
MSSITCSMCGSVLGNAAPEAGSTKVFCGFCDMKVEPSVNGERLDDKVLLPVVSYHHIELKTPELMELHTVSLLQLLKLMREERGSLYKNMQTLNKASHMYPSKFSEGAKEAGKEYEKITRKIFVAETILKPRLGYIPEKITNDLLIKYEQMAKNPRNDKPMTIGQQEKKRELQEPARSR